MAAKTEGSFHIAPLRSGDFAFHWQFEKRDAACSNPKINYEVRKHEYENEFAS
jgi:hypothetical protein